MRKERMTVEELNSLKPSYDNPITLMCDDIEYWDCDDNTERLYYACKDEAIEAYLDEERSLVEIEVYGFSRMIVDPKRFQSVILEAALDYLNEGFDGEDGHEQNEAIEDAALVFVKTYLNNYTTHSCDLVKTEKINVKEWVKANRPDWLSREVTDEIEKLEWR